MIPIYFDDVSMCMYKVVKLKPLFILRQTLKRNTIWRRVVLYKKS